MKKDKSKILNAVHQTAVDLHQSGALPTVTMNKFNRLCIPAVHELSAKDIKNIRETTHLSQAVFAAYLNISVSTIQKWEVGAKKPTGLALKVLNLIQKKGVHAFA
ncbi:MAG: helix-turn-helix domain-containing protein [Gammaproteobacteria bacterium]